MKNNLKKSKLLISPELGIYSNLYKDIYFDKYNGIKETQHNFLKANNLESRFKKANKFIISELGFGTGLSFLMTLKLWKKTRKPNGKLIFISFESAPLTKFELKKVYKYVKGLKILSSQLIKKLPSLYQSTHRIYFEVDNVELILIYDDFKSLINFKFSVDAWFLDGFAPKKNTSAWNSKLFEQIYLATNFQGTFSTFTVAGHVRRGLSNSGFSVLKISGFSNKKECLIGIKKTLSSEINKSSSSDNHIGPVAIIGSGISGASLAYSLRKRNIECFVVDKSSTFASGASGNKLALQMPKLTLDNSPYGLLSLEAFTYSRNLAKNLNSIPPSDGLIVLPSRERDHVKYLKLLQNNWPLDLISNKIEKPNFLENINYIYMKSSGILDNKKFIKNLIKDVKFITNFDVKKILNTKDSFKILIDKNGNKLKAKTVIWANGYEMKNLSNNLPINSISGQVTYLKENKAYSNFKLNFSYGHHFSQAFKGYHQVGSSFNRNENMDYKEVDQINNLNSIPEFLVKLIKDFKGEKNYRVSIRASTKDRMPFFCSLETIINKNIKNEYLLGGMGSWGFVYAPLYAEFLIKSLLGEPLIISSNLERLLRVNRFL
ncbi:tRNA (5-methylaminomethyl-2-thiouridine)(34)-methyltransferase MnmD [bacterium]|nr:tRNA (5-methylaminomethyl-2-thiouridine)(34)-methyltransferase MnmD [bacterium]